MLGNNFQTIRIFNYRFYIKELLLLLFTYLMMEGLFSWLVLPNSIIYGMYEKLLSIFIYVYVLYSFNRLTTNEKVYVGVFTLLMIKLVFESLYYYGNMFNQFTIYTVIYPVIFVVFIKFMCRSMEFDILEFLAKFYLFTYVVFMVLYGRGFSFSLDMVEMNDYGPFSGDSRVIHARSIFMIIIPYLWYLNRFVHTKKWTYLGYLLFCVIIIVIHQHRSVWSSTIIATILYMLMNTRNNQKTIYGFYTLLIIGLVLGSVLYFYIANLKPGFIDFFAERFGEIFNPSKEGSTGNFRIEQTSVYYDYIRQRPLLGWTFKGFELPNPLVDWWEENTGHHFHQGFIEILFYHGIVGLILKYSVLIIILVKAFTTKLPQQAIIMSSFCICGLVFSLSYVLPIVFWGHVGVCLYYLESKKITDDIYSDTGTQQA